MREKALSVVEVEIEVKGMVLESFYCEFLQE